MTAASVKNIWPHKSALVVSDDELIPRALKEMLKHVGWGLGAHIRSAEIAKETLNKNRFGCVIVIDTLSLPAEESLRELYLSPALRLMPTLVYKSDAAHDDALIFEKIFGTYFLGGSLSHKHFTSEFSRMIDAWTPPVMEALRIIGVTIEDQQDKTKIISILERLSLDEKAFFYSLNAMIRIFIQLNNFQDAEKRLLKLLRADAKNPALFATCAWFYLDALMPGYALSFFKKLKEMSPNSLLFNFDIAAANLFDGQIPGSIDALVEWNHKRPGNARIESYIGRLLVSEGLLQNADQAGVPRQLVSRIAEIWRKVELPKITSLSKNHSGNKAS